MRIALLISLVASFAVAAPTAMATPIEVTDAEAVHCADLSFSGDGVSGGCEAHVTGTGIRTGLRVTGNPFTYAAYHDCSVEATLWLDENGNAAVTDVTMTNCTEVIPSNLDPPVPCAGAQAHAAAPNNGEDPWRSSDAASETAADTVSLPIGVCFIYSDGAGGSIDCEGSIPLEIDTGAAPYTLTADQANILPAIWSGPGFSVPGPPCWIDGTWSVEGDPFTITHL